MSNVRFALACPLLLCGLALVWVGRRVLSAEDRLGFDERFWRPQD